MNLRLHLDNHFSMLTTSGLLDVIVADSQGFATLRRVNVTSSCDVGGAGSPQLKGRSEKPFIATIEPGWTPTRRVNLASFAKSG